jgi:hypothetical protein
LAFVKRVMRLKNPVLNGRGKQPSLRTRRAVYTGFKELTFDGGYAASFHIASTTSFSRIGFEKNSAPIGKSCCLGITWPEVRII